MLEIVDSCSKVVHPGFAEASASLNSDVLKAEQSMARMTPCLGTCLTCRFPLGSTRAY